MAGSRKERVAAALRDELAELIVREIKDPRIHAAGPLTVTQVKLVDDLRVATVLVSFVGGSDEAATAAIVALGAAAGFLRGEVARRLTLRRAPELRFLHDRSAAAVARIDALLRGDGGDDG